MCSRPELTRTRYDPTRSDPTRPDPTRLTRLPPLLEKKSQVLRICPIKKTPMVKSRVMGRLALAMVLMAMILPSKGMQVDLKEWSRMCCEKGGDGVDMAKAVVMRTLKGYSIELVVAGISDLKIDVKKDKHEVWVSGERVRPTDKYLVSDRTYGQFWRRFRFPPAALMDRLNFRFRDGVLHIDAPIPF
ncbi:hypothetical protein RND81_06G233900 [Saponaria officinalis]|uniref:SHSP domain-containing protein n=1 Tax=Saponaria officinalis TaxID=3572 RepID=A0AAW1KF25_SAPOF